MANFSLRYKAHETLGIKALLSGYGFHLFCENAFLAASICVE